MRAALIGAVDFNERHFAATSFDFVVAVDRGWETCQRFGIEADLAVGDFDSLGYVPEGTKVKCFPTEKDESDMELALREALDQGADELYFYGSLSQRLDHTFSNFAVMASAARLGVWAVGVGEDFASLFLASGSDRLDLCTSVRACSALEIAAFDPDTLTGEYAPYLSLFAYGADATGVAIDGLRYEAKGLSLSAFLSRGLSNEFVGKRARISVEEGTLLLFLPLGALAFVSPCSQEQ